MKVPRHVVESRQQRLAEILQKHRYLPLQQLCEELQVSEATVRRDLVNLEKNGIITRTYGGALSDFNIRFKSFRERQADQAEAKAELSKRGHSLIKPGQTICLDGGTTLYALGERLREQPIHPLTCVTNNLPVADLLAEIEGVSVHLLGGQFLHRQSVLVGDQAAKAVRSWHFDLAFCSAQGMNAEGVWNSRPEIIAVQRAIIRQSRANIFVLDKTKIGHTTDHLLVGWGQVGGLLTDATESELTEAGIPHQKIELDQLTLPFSTPSDTDSSLPTNLL